VHFAELSRIQCGYSDVGLVPRTHLYPLYDFTSSGLTHSWDGPVKRAMVNSVLMGTHRVGDFYNGKSWGEIEVAWAEVDSPASGASSSAPVPSSVIDRRRTQITFRIWGVEDNAVHIQKTVSLAALSYDTAEPPSVGLAASIEQCAAASTSRGYDPACQAFMATCRPTFGVKDHAYYYAGHAALLAVVLVALAAVTTSPVAALMYGKRFFPGGTIAAVISVALAQAVFWNFVAGIH
jgi:hypothetical protein